MSSKGVLETPPKDRMLALEEINGVGELTLGIFATCCILIQPEPRELFQWMNAVAFSMRCSAALFYGRAEP